MRKMYQNNIFYRAQALPTKENLIPSIKKLFDLLILVAIVRICYLFPNQLIKQVV